MACHQLALQLGVAFGFLAMRTQEVANREMPRLMLAGGFADMEVIAAWTPRRLGEEVVIRRAGVRHEEITDALKRLDVAAPRLDGLDGEQEIEDGLGSEAGHRRRTNVLHAHRDVTRGLPDAVELPRRPRGPGRVVGNDADRWIDPIV